MGYWGDLTSAITLSITGVFVGLVARLLPDPHNEDLDGAALLAAIVYNHHASRPIRSILSPAFGTGIGSMDFRCAAQQMFAAYRAVVLNERPWLKCARSVLGRHHELLK